MVRHVKTLFTKKSPAVHNFILTLGMGSITICCVGGDEPDPQRLKSKVTSGATSGKP